MNGTALILGASGRFGRHMAEALWNAGWRIRTFDRATDDLNLAARDVDLIVNGWNPPYHRWKAELPGLTRDVIAAAKLSGARVVLAGNVYVYGNGSGGALSAALPHEATNPLGRLRIEMEQAYRDAGVPLLILRSGDFLDTQASGNWFDRFISAPLSKGRIAYPGDPDVPHAWAYLPDVARLGAAVLARADLPHQLEVLTPDFTLTGRDMASALSDILGRDISAGRFAWWPLYLLRPVLPIVRGVIEMRYLWDMPHWMDGQDSRRWAPGFTSTPLLEALANCAPVNDLLASADRPRQARGGLPPQPGSQAPAR